MFTEKPPHFTGVRGAGLSPGIGKVLAFWCRAPALCVQEVIHDRVIAEPVWLIFGHAVEVLVSPLFSGLRIDKEAGRRLGSKSCCIDADLAAASVDAFERIQLELAGCVVA